MNDELIQKGKEALRRAVSRCGSQSELARRIGKRQGHVWDWLNKPMLIPAEVCIPIERATDGYVRRGDLRPDLYPDDISPSGVETVARADAQPERAGFTSRGQRAVAG